jgi:hypothetical protein
VLPGAGLGLRWRPIGELTDGLARGYALATAHDADPDAAGLRDRCAADIARCLGAGEDR